jgi:hypothetical protein
MGIGVSPDLWLELETTNGSLSCFATGVSAQTRLDPKAATLRLSRRHAPSLTFVK